MSIFAWIILGLIAGALAKLIMPGNQSNNWLLTIVLGVAGAILGGFVSTLLGWGGINGFTLQSIFLSICGSLLLLWIASSGSTHRRYHHRRYRRYKY